MSTIFNIDLGITAEETYSIAGKQIKFDSLKDIEPYLKELDDSKILFKKIDISGNTISPECSEHLAKSLARFSESLVELNLQDIYTSRDKDEIPASLTFFFNTIIDNKFLKLSVLNLSDNAYGQDAISTLEAFISKAISLEHLILTNNGLGPFSGARVGKALYNLSVAKANHNATASESDKVPAGLKTFQCGRNRLEDGSIDYLSIGLRSHKATLENVRFYQNGIRVNGIAKLLSQSLKHCTNLKVVDLQDNTFTYRGGLALSLAVPNWTKIEEINVNDCLLNKKGSLAFIQALLDLPVEESTLTTLKLQFNELQSDSLEVLAKAIESKLVNLKSLELNGNTFEEDDDSIEKINSIFEDRGFGELDELDELEELDSDEEEDDPSEEDEEKEEYNVDIDELEKELAAAHI